MKLTLKEEISRLSGATLFELLSLKQLREIDVAWNQSKDYQCFKAEVNKAIEYSLAMGGYQLVCSHVDSDEDYYTERFDTREDIIEVAASDAVIVHAVIHGGEDVSHKEPWSESME